MVQNQRAIVPDGNTFTDASPNPNTDIDLADVCAALSKLGILRVTARYEGYGDSGCVEELTYSPDTIAVPGELDDKLQDVAAEYCPDGYENNEGGFGTLTLYLREGLAEREHCDRFTSTEDMDIAPVPLPDELRAKLSMVGVKTVAATFDGYGDSGQIESLEVEPTGTALGAALETELDDFLNAQPPDGYENNAGGFGDFLVDVFAGEVHVNASWRLDDETEAEVTRWNWRQSWPTPTITL